MKIYITLLVLILSVQNNAENCFRAAVYEHVTQGGNNDTAIAANLDVYAKVAEEAKADVKKFDKFKRCTCKKSLYCNKLH